MHRRLVPTLLVLASLAVPAAAAADACPATVPVVDDRCELWTDLYDHPGGYGSGGKDIVFEVAAGDGRVVVTGRSEDDLSGGYDALTIAYDASTGERLWVHRYDSGGPDSGNAVTLSPDGSRAYVTGYRSSSGLLLLSYDTATGSLLWSADWASPAHAATTGIEARATGDRVYVAAIGSIDSANRDIVVAAFGAGGGRLWSSAVDHEGGYDVAVGLEVSPDGRRVVVGGSTRQCCGTDDDYLVAGLDAGPPDEEGELPPTAGTVQWKQTYDGGKHLRDVVGDLAMRPDGSMVYLTGTSAKVAGSLGTLADDSFLTLAVDTATGSRRWAHRLDSGHPGSEGGAGIAVSPDGTTVVVTGDHAAPASHFDDDWGTTAYDAETGEQRWFARYGVPGLIYEQPKAVVIANGRAFVHGFSGDGVYKGEFVTVAYSLTTGAPAWVGRHQTAAVDRPFTRSIATDGARVYATGYLRNNVVGLSCSDCNEYDYLTMAYEA